MHGIVSGHLVEPVAQLLNRIRLVQWHFCDGNSCPLFLSVTTKSTHRHKAWRGPQKLLELDLLLSTSPHQYITDQ